MATKKQYQTLGSTAQGTALGATIGTAIAPGIGTAIGAGVGGLGGFAIQKSMGESEYDKYRRQQIQKLKRQQEMGTLGLTDKERAIMEEQILGPVRAQQRQALLYGLGAAGGAGAQPADISRMQLGAEERVAETTAPALAKMAEVDIKKAAAQEQQLMAMQAEEAREIEASKQQALGSLFAAATGFAGAAGQAGQARAQKEFQAGMLDIMGEQAAGGQDISQSMMMYEFLYGGQRAPGGTR